MSEEIRNLLEGLPFWKHLKEEEKRQLEEASREVHYPAGGRRLFRCRRMPGGNLYFKRNIQDISSLR